MPGMFFILEHSQCPPYSLPFQCNTIIDIHQVCSSLPAHLSQFHWLEVTVCVNPQVSILKCSVDICLVLSNNVVHIWKSVSFVVLGAIGRFLFGSEKRSEERSEERPPPPCKILKILHNIRTSF